jgi:hypothetical protein
MYAGADCCRFALFVEIVATVSDEGPGMTIGHHVSPKVAAIHVANRNGTAVAIEGAGFARNLAVADEGAQVSGGRLSCGPSIGARLTRFWRVDSPQSIGHAINPESIAINHPDGLGIDRQDYKREGGGEDRELHQISVV